MRLFTRFGAIVAVGAFSLISLALLLLTEGVTTRIQAYGVGLPWTRPKTTGPDVRLVVFGDSWVDDGRGETGVLRDAGQGPSWTTMLCGDVRCIDVCALREWHY